MNVMGPAAEGEEHNQFFGYQFCKKFDVVGLPPQEATKLRVLFCLKKRLPYLGAYLRRRKEQSPSLNESQSLVLF